ncbi:hypothetical protein ColLi_12161 [Colletotrichum liriopes]|uniref:Uncharacterized protein n=1 Tax=Colletotrichum liriopes TaxID=708192 RepID=A0AA37LZC8_9PEZI|nr:hypothetical protein ColLi_12161 [Colletotrichum liriopes]
MEGPYVDTMMFLKITFPTAEKGPGQMAFVMKPRTGLRIGMMNQALCSLPTKEDAMMSINGYNNLIMMTAAARTMVNNESEDCTVVIPWRNMVMAFINIQQNTEDACVVSKEFAESG